MKFFGKTIILSILLFSVLVSCGRTSHCRQTTDLLMLANSIWMYKYEFGRFPVSDGWLDVNALLGENPRGIKFFDEPTIHIRFGAEESGRIVLNDFWGNPITVTFTPRFLLVRSPGEDGVFGTGKESDDKEVFVPRPEWVLHSGAPQGSE